MLISIWGKSGTIPKYKINPKEFAKPCTAQTRHGICAVVAAPGKANDSPHLVAMPAMMLRGSGDAPADAQRDGIENCKAAKNGGHRHVIESESGYEIKGFNAGAEMPRLVEKHPPPTGTFRKLRRKRNDVETRP